jgi:uncharacterized protein YcfJ
MKKLALALASICTVAAPLAQAAYDRYGNYYEPRTPSRQERQEFARVIESRPVYQSANTREECWNPRAGHFEERRNTRDSNANGTVAGALLGGVLGHQVDHGTGTAAGAILGGIIGNQIDRSNNSNPQDDLDYSRCRVVAEGGRDLQGYDVRYSYRGQEYTTRLAQEPGRRLRVGEDIRDDGMPFETASSYSNAYSWR